MAKRFYTVLILPDATAQARRPRKRSPQARRRHAARAEEDRPSSPAETARAEKGR